MNRFTIVSLLIPLTIACTVEEPPDEVANTTASVNKEVHDDCGCDPTLACGDALTCWDDGFLYPSTCGPDNCDEPIGYCDSKCDPNQVCGDALTCWDDGLLYPSTCGPTNCDEPIGPCEPQCDPSLICAEVITCWEDGLQYPTACGPTNCDEPIGACPE
jgi:hypothetical protein